MIRDFTALRMSRIQEWSQRAAQLPVLEPSDSSEAKEFMKSAFDPSERFDRPFVFRTTTRLAHSQGLVELCDREEIPDKPYEKKNIRKTVR